MRAHTVDVHSRGQGHASLVKVDGGQTADCGCGRPHHGLQPATTTKTRPEPKVVYLLVRGAEKRHHYTVQQRLAWVGGDVHQQPLSALGSALQACSAWCGVVSDVVWCGLGWCGVVRRDYFLLQEHIQSA